MKTINIAGAGIIGLAAAWRLAQRGWKATVFDRREAAHEATWAAAGMLAPGGEIEDDSTLARMAMRSLALYPEFVRDLEEETGLSIEYRRCGAIEVAFDEAGLQALNEKAERQSALGIHSEPCHYQGRDARRYKNDAVVDPLSIREALLTACRNRGIDIRENEPVIEILVHGVATKLGTYPSDRILIAAGAWSSSLLSGLPRAFPVRGHLISFEIEPGYLPMILRGNHTYIVQRESGALIAGSSMENAGFDRAIDLEIVAGIHREAAKLLPRLAGMKPANSWTGLRPATDIGPVIGRFGETHIWTAYGHFRNGILLAPDTANTIAEEIDR
jgi:glycine oxidase